ncbi:hypothetical protein V8E53_015557 [Lactarius tabidus]
MTKRSCLVCSNPAANWCAGCKSASYCDKEHQKKDWQSHKEYCLKVKAAGANTFDAILFPANESKPRLVKIPWQLNHFDAGFDDVPMLLPFHDLDTDIWFMHADKDVRSIYIDRWPINGPELGRGLCFKYDENSIINGLPLNRYIIDVTGGRAGHPWCGNILALRMESLRSYDFYASVDMKEDLKPFVAYFEEYNKVVPVY